MRKFIISEDLLKQIFDCNQCNRWKKYDCCSGDCNIDNILQTIKDTYDIDLIEEYLFEE